MKLLFWFAFIVIVVLALKKKSRQLPQALNQAEPDLPPAETGEAENMLCCAHCQVYFPASEAVYKQQRVFCSQAHADLS